MIDQRRTLLRRLSPIQTTLFSSQAQTSMTIAIEKYARELFHELLRIEHHAEDHEKSTQRYINAFTFWKYSKLPKLVSDRLFESICEEQKLSCPDLIEWLSVEIRGTPKEQMMIVFKMLDGDKNGLVTREECVTVLSHAIANPLNKSYEQCERERSLIIKLVDSFYSDQNIQEANLASYMAWYSQGRWELHDAIWDCLTDTLRSREKVTNYMKLIESKTNDEQADDVTQISHKTKTIPVLCQGKMYCMTESGLRSAYYKLVNTELYQLKKPEHQKYKSVTYLGHGAYVVPFIPRIETTDNQRLSGQKELRLYILGEENYLNWKNALEQVTSSKAEILKDYTFKEDLGRGRYGQVKLGVCNKTGKRVAIKVLQKKAMDSFTINLVSQEINVQKMCKHRNLLQILDVYEDIQCVYLVIELMEARTLTDYIFQQQEQGVKIEKNVIMCIIYQLAQAIQYLKQFNIVHRDIKGSNILLSGKVLDFQIGGKPLQVPEIKLCDFSVSTIISNAVRRQYCGSLTHIAPQILEGSTYNHQVDMFSLGVVIYQCLTGSLPFFSPKVDKVKDLIKYGEPKSMNELKLTQPALFYHLVQNLLSKRPSDRLDIDTLLSLPQFKAIQLI